MAYQWIISFTTISSTQPTPPANKEVVDLVSGLFTQPTAIWLAGPQSVDDGAAPTSVWEWMISCRTESSNAPSLSMVTAAVTAVFGPTAGNVWLAGPQSVDDSDVIEQNSDK